MAKVHDACSAHGPLSQQQALRLVLGMGYSQEAAVAKWRDVVAWRRANDMDVLRGRLEQLMVLREPPVSFAHEREVYSARISGFRCLLRLAFSQAYIILYSLEIL